jgi:3-deoxy-7-phosphoheptulonate synthase
VTPSEVIDFRNQLAEVALGKRFLLQGGDCAERFQDCAADSIDKKLRILLQMSLVLTWGARVPTLRVARMAGQFAKPRSKDTEVIDGVELPAFRGDNINSFDTSARSPDPARMLQGYFHSAATLNYARAVLASGLGDLHAAAAWDLGFVSDSGHRKQYKDIIDRILSALDFMRVCGAGDEDALKVAKVFMSHEGLHLAYEETQTRAGVDAFSSKPAAAAAAAAARNCGGGASAVPVIPENPVITTPYFNLGTHFLWIGDRTRQLNHAHVEYFRGIENPIGIKAGPTSSPTELVDVIRRLWPSPSAAPGKIVIITRMGASAVKDKLPALVNAVMAANFTSPVVWVSDPMHGNTRVSSNGYKTRNFDDILCELK